VRENLADPTILQAHYPDYAENYDNSDDWKGIDARRLLKWNLSTDEANAGRSAGGTEVFSSMRGAHKIGRKAYGCVILIKIITVSSSKSRANSAE